jgi:DNA-binding NtrC family response regulator
MAVQRARSTELARLFNAAKQPIYVLDEDLTIVFLNRACEDWLATPESLVGRRCGYHSSLAVTGLDAVAAGLCPPPGVLAGNTVVAMVSGAGESGRSAVRRARFVPLGLEEECLLGVLAVVDTADQPPALVETDRATELREAEPIALHEHVRQFRQEAAARYRADRLIGEGPAMRLARRQVALATGGGSSVLLVGPPGSGRRHLAAAIHYGDSPPSPERLTVPTLVPLDCSLLGADLLEEVASAVARGRALGEKTAPGTLLLHRVDEISTDLQVELAGLFVRRPINWRLMATASESLAELARRGKFREDLAAALSTIVIELPPLARRRDDLPLLAQLFLEDLNAAGRRQIGGFTAAALDLLDGYAWPGNLDELAEVVAESHRRAAGREIDVADLPERLRLAGQAAARPHRPEETIVLGEYLARVERELIRRALARAKGNKSRAARLLGMTRPRFYRRMVQLGLE